MAKAGNAQNGWMRLVQASPQAMEMPVRPGSTPRLAPAVKNTGAWMAQWPPPEGTNRLRTAAHRKVSSGKVVGVEMPMQASLMTVP